MQSTFEDVFKTALYDFNSYTKVMSECVCVDIETYPLDIEDEAES